MRMHAEISPKNESKANPNIAELPESLEVKKPNPVMVTVQTRVIMARMRPAFDNFIAMLSGSFR